MDAPKDYVAPRTCTTVGEGGGQEPAERKSIPMARLVDSAAYVLIAEPGAGKTTAFKAEAARKGAAYATVRDFRTFDDKPEWHGTTLFLDGLDEARAGAEDGRMPLDDIRRKLHGLGRPRFRLSCRWADWLAANDKEDLEKVSPDGAVAVVRLDPLSERNVKDILAKNHGVDDADAFVAAARTGCRLTAEKPAEPRPVREIGGAGQVADVPQGDVRGGPAGCSPASRTGSTGS